MISTLGFLGRTHEWRWMSKTHGVENLLTHLRLSKKMRHTVSHEALHPMLQSFVSFLIWLLKDLFLLFSEI